MFYTSDLITQYFPWYFMASQYLKSFSLPHFVKGIYENGYPLLAQGETGVLSPINSIVLFLFPFFAAIYLLYLIYFSIAIIGTYLFLKEYKTSTLSSILGGIIFAFSGFMVSRYFQPSIIFTSALLPFGVYLILKAKNDNRYLFFLSPLIYLQITAGHLQMTLISCFIYVFFGIIQFYLDKKPLAFFIKFFAILTLEFLLSAPQLLPSFKLYELSKRKNWNPNLRYTYSLPPQHLITYIKPFAYGLSKPGDDLGFKQFGGGFWEINLTIWTIPFILSLAPLLYVFKNKNRQVIVLYLIWIFFIALSFGGFFKPNRIINLIHDFPFRSPARFLLITTFTASTLSAIGFELLTKKLSIQIKLVVFIIVLASIFSQQMILYRSYFIFKNPKEISSDLKNHKIKLTTPLELNWNNPKLNTTSFKNEFYKGLAIMLFSLLFLFIWYLVETKAKNRLKVKKV